VINAPWMVRASTFVWVGVALSACSVPTRIKPNEPTFATMVASELEISDIVFDFKHRENKTYEPVMTVWSVDQRILAEPPLAKFIQDDVGNFVKRHTYLDPTVPATIHVTVTKAQINVYKLPSFIPFAGSFSRGIGAESNVKLSRVRGDKTEASCEFADPVKSKDINDWTPERLRISVETVVSQYRQTLIDELEKRCGSVFASSPATP